VGARFSAIVQTARWARLASYTIYNGSFPRVKQPEGGVDHPTPSSTEVKERVTLFFYFPLGLRSLF